MLHHQFRVLRGIGLLMYRRPELVPILIGRSAHDDLRVSPPRRMSGPRGCGKTSSGGFTPPVLVEPVGFVAASRSDRDKFRRRYISKNRPSSCHGNLSIDDVRECASPAPAARPAELSAESLAGMSFSTCPQSPTAPRQRVRRLLRLHRFTRRRRWRACFRRRCRRRIVARAVCPRWIPIPPVLERGRDLSR